MRTLYFDCFSGAAGDMLLGALLDAGADEGSVRAQLEGLELPGWHLEISPVTRSGVRATHVIVRTQDDQPTRDHAEIRSILSASRLTDDVRRTAEAIFTALAKAEARVHGVDVEHVHLHEVAAVDAFIDIVGTAAALESLAPDRILCSPVAVGGGTTRSAHGALPVPAPAVAELLTGVPIRGGGDRELLTPTGAAILATVVERFGELPPMRLETTGYGAGTAETEMPNLVRVFVGESSDAKGRAATLLETNLDDMSPELVPRLIERLLAAGAFDAWTTPIVMKKGRPAFTISALAADKDKDRLLDVLYTETTTFGVRMVPVSKDELERRWVEVEVEGHPVRVKQALRNDRVITQSPEYEEASKVASATGIPLKEVYRLALRAAEERMSKS